MNHNSPIAANYTKQPPQIIAATTVRLFPRYARLKKRLRQSFPAPDQPHINHPTMLSEELLRRQAKAAPCDRTSAINLLTQAIAANPSNAINYNNRGLIYFQNGQEQKALADYTTAIELNPQLSEAYNNRGNYYASKGDLEVARSDYDRSIDINPFNIRAWINRGITFRHLRMYDLSLDNLDFALRMGRLQAHIYGERGRTYHAMGDWNCAIADYQRSLAQFSRQNSDPNSPELRQRLRVEAWLNDLLRPLLA